MIQGLRMEQAADPEYIFGAGRAFVETFGASIGAADIDPFTRPLDYARAMRQLDPRNQIDGVFKAPENAGRDTFADRFEVADNGLPAWAAAEINVAYDAAHQLGIRNRETGSTFTYNYPEGQFELGIALEGANKTSELRARGLASAVQAGTLVLSHLVVASTGRRVKPAEGHPAHVKTGHDVGAGVVKLLRSEYNDVFTGKGRVQLAHIDLDTHLANTQEAVVEAALRTRAVQERPISSVVLSGSNIYGSWMQTDLAAAKHILGMQAVGFGAPADSAKAARTDPIWIAEIAKAQASAALLQNTYNTKRR